MNRQRLAILGSTGSIGTSTLDVAARHSDRYDVVALAAATNVERMVQQCHQFRPRVAAMASPRHAEQLATRLRVLGIATEVESGDEAVRQLAAAPEVDSVMAAIVGAAGLASSLAAARSGKRLLLANKEALVMGGSLFLEAVHAGRATLIPIDSEHSAIFQALPEDRSAWRQRVEKIILTASGGPFRMRDPATFPEVTPEQACAHPTWVMGRKISVDSATMMNKALEVIEAHYLFGLDPSRIEVVIHPESVIHSMVQYRDGSVLAQLGTPDMRVPIAYGLAWPERMESGAQALDFNRAHEWHFEPAMSAGHKERYPGLALAWETLAGPPGGCAVLNAANEVAVDAFLQRRIRFDQIHELIRATLERVELGSLDGIEALLELDARARIAADRLVRAWCDGHRPMHA